MISFHHPTISEPQNLSIDAFQLHRVLWQTYFVAPEPRVVRSDWTSRQAGWIMNFICMSGSKHSCEHISYKPRWMGPRMWFMGLVHSYLTGHLTMPESHTRRIAKSCALHKCVSRDFKALKLWNVRTGSMWNTAAALAARRVGGGTMEDKKWNIVMPLFGI